MKNTFVFSLSFALTVLFCYVVADDRAKESQLGAANASSDDGKVGPRLPLAVGHPTFVSPHASPIALHGDRVFVVNTPADTVDVINAKTQEPVVRVSVGIDPVSIAVRPDGKEVWVSNHVSDSVSVIDNDADSPTYLQVIATVQEFDPETRATRFDEPVGIAFASNEKAYVALSSENTIAVVDAATHQVVNRLTIAAQDPRAIVVRKGRLYVVPFESNNKTQLSGGNRDNIDGELVTFDAWEHSVRVNNVLSLGHVTDIVKHPEVPDQDLFVFDTETDKLVGTVNTLGTLLYGLAVDSLGHVFIAQTDARNDVNGRSGTKKHDLTELENRAFLNQITRIEPLAIGTQGADTENEAGVEFIDLEPLPPDHPKKDEALATPFAIEVTDDDSTLVVSAAGSDKLFTVDAESGEVLGRIAVGAVPRGIALENSPSGVATKAWVLNAVANTVSIVDVSDPANLQVVGFVRLEDPTHPQLKLGRTWFNDADASSTGTFSCASCHPDGHTDQLLWVLKTPIVSGGDQIMPRSTMPIRGLRDTAPFHWDGIPGDPYGGNNSANIHASVPPNSDVADPESTTRHLIDGGLATTMLQEGDQTINDEGKAGAFSAAERDDMAKFLLGVPYPPAQRRAYTNEVSSEAEEGFKLFHIYGDNDPTKSSPNVCGNCHRMPFLVSTNTPGTGMDAPTWRGAYDRYLILPQGRLNIIDFDFYRPIAEQGQPERNIWQLSWGLRQRFDPVWNMVLEGSTGFSGTFARQVTVNKASVDEELTKDLLAALELSAREGAIVLECDGVITDASQPRRITLQFDADYSGGTYVEKEADRDVYDRAGLMALAAGGNFVGTFTARHGADADVEHPQPAIWTQGPIEQQRGLQEFPILYDGNERMTTSGRHIDRDAIVIVDGRRTHGNVELGENEEIVIELETLPSVGMHLLQLQNPNGMFSNDFIFHVTVDKEGAVDLKRSIDAVHEDKSDPLTAALIKGNLRRVKKLLEKKERINRRMEKDGSTPLSMAALHGHHDVIEYLIDQGADVNATNRDGNTPLHVAAFLCRSDIMQLLLDAGASPLTKNNRGESPIDVVSSEWSQPLADFYTAITAPVGIEIDLEHIEGERPRIAEKLHEHVEDSQQENNKPNAKRIGREDKNERAHTQFDAKLRELVAAEKLTREEAAELRKAAFPDED